MDGRLEDAIIFAATVHKGQVYKGYDPFEDEPYILHPLRVMAMVPAYAKIVAVLHDTLEDRGTYPLWLSGEEMEALRLLTRQKYNESYDMYIEEIVHSSGISGEIAKKVKIADLLDNMSRNPPARLKERYQDALRQLSRS